MVKKFFSNPFQGKSVLAEKDFSAAQFNYLIDFALHLKTLKQQNIPHQYLKNQNIALIFEKPSTRTRSAFTIAANDLGAHPTYLGQNDIHIGDEESISDTAKVLGSMFDGIEFRGSKQKDVEILAQKSGVPVWNGLTEEWHPTQMLADFMTIKEEFGYIKGINLTYIGDGHDNVANSLLVTGAMLGANIHIVAPKKLQPNDSKINLAKNLAINSGSHLMITEDIEKGIKNSNIIYSDVWVSMGENNWKERIQLLKPYQVNLNIMKKTHTPDDQLIFMHCLPSFHNLETTQSQKIYNEYGISSMEVSDEVFNSKYAEQFVEAENRLHSIKAIMAATAGNLFIPDI